MPRRRAYLLALTCLVIAGMLRLAFDPLLGERAPGSLFIIGIGITAWYAGFWPALVSLLVTVPIVHYGFGRALENLPRSSNAVTLISYIVFGLILCYFGERQRLGRLRNRRDARDLAVQKSYFERLFESSQDGVIILSPEGKVIGINSNGLSLIGFGNLNDVTGKDLESLWNVQEPGGVRTSVAMAREGKVSKLEASCQDVDGSTKWCEIVISPIQGQGGKVEAILAVARDITERREMDETLHKTVAQRTQDLLDTNEKLQGFIYSLAHDFRQHIRGISTNASIILHDSADTTDPETRQTLERLVSSAKHLGEMTDDLLAHAKLGRAGLRIEKVDVTELASQAVEAVRQEPYCPTSVEFRIQDGLAAEADRALLKLVLENLLDNACKYSQLAKAAVVELGRDEEGFFVRDNGVGFSMAYAHKLFQPFERLHRETEFRGTGIGLANVKQAIDKHGGRIWAESEPEKGATFHFTLP
ncbi:MAG: ATP-binding protein [Fimbriimonadaceae bacterium]